MVTMGTLRWKNEANTDRQCAKADGMPGNVDLLGGPHTHLLCVRHVIGSRIVAWRASAGE